MGGGSRRTWRASSFEAPHRVTVVADAWLGRAPYWFELVHERLPSVEPFASHARTRRAGGDAMVLRRVASAGGCWLDCPISFRSMSRLGMAQRFNGRSTETPRSDGRGGESKVNVSSKSLMTRDSRWGAAVVCVLIRR
jgi:hypothetical protein